MPIFIGKTASVLSTILKGLGQIMLQENSVTGLLFLIGIFYGSIIMGLAALLATICGTVTAYLLKYDKPKSPRVYTALARLWSAWRLCCS